MPTEGKPPRSAAQKAATRRMIAANRRGRGSPRRSRRGTSAPSRRRPKTVHRVGQVAAGVLALAALNLPGTDGGSIIRDFKDPSSETPLQRVANAATNLRSSVLSSQNAYWAPTRTAAYGAIGVFAASKIVGHFVPSLRKTMKIGKARIAIAG